LDTTETSIFDELVRRIEEFQVGFHAKQYW